MSSRKNTTKTSRKPALGRGLSALIPSRATPTAEADPGDGRPRLVPVEAIQANRHQPRSRFDEDALAQLAASIRESGVLQPIVVAQEDGGFRIIAGERRFRAARQAGLTQVPVVLRDIGEDREWLELALVENLQRSDLNPMEEAEAYRSLRDEFGMTQEQIAKRVGRDRSSVANTLRLLRLPEVVRELLRSGDLTTGHAKAILGLEQDSDRVALAEQIVSRGMSVRDAEQWVAARPDEAAAAPVPRRPKPDKDVFTREAEEKLALHLHSKTEIIRRRRGGEIRIRFSSEEELMRLYDVLMATREGRRA